MSQASAELFDSGWLSLRDGAEVYWEVSGNPDGAPLLWLHGGPGTGLGSGGYKRQPDPEKWLLIGLDQRGCGRSRPLANTDGFDMETLRMPALVGDLEQLREHLGVDRWLIVGGSFGSTLAMAYGQTHPHRVIAFVLMAIADGSRDYVEWISEGVSRIFPEAWVEFEQGVDRHPGETLLDTYVRHLSHPDTAVRDRAALAWCTWEDAHMQIPGGLKPSLAARDPEWRQVYALQVAWSWATQFSLDEQGVLGRLDRISHIPAVLVHGRLDISGPARGPWMLHQQWPASRLLIIEDEGHGGPQMTATWRAALEDLHQELRLGT